MTPILTELRNHYNQLAPHIKQRQSAQLIKPATTPSQQKWKAKWLTNARLLGAGPE